MHLPECIELTVPNRYKTDNINVFILNVIPQTSLFLCLLWCNLHTNLLLVLDQICICVSEQVHMHLFTLVFLFLLYTYVSK
jgi:hypothetical protein